MSLKVNIKKRLGNFNLDVAFETERGVFAILGASGCGKSMTLKSIAGIEPPESGLIKIEGKTVYDSENKVNLKPQKRNIGYLFQNYALFPTMTVEKNIAAGLKGKKQENAKRVREMIEKFQLTGLEKRFPAELSGGQQQRVAIARSLVTEPKIIFADEPTGNLDTKTTIEILSFLQQIVRKRQCTLIMVSHDLEVAQYADRIIHMRDGKVIKITEGEAAIKELTKAEEIIESLPDIEEPKTESPQSAQEKEPEAEKAKILNEEDTEEKR